MTGQDYRTIAHVIRTLPCDRLIVAEDLAAMFAKEDPHFNQNRFLAAALWGIEQQADRAIAESDCRTRTRQAPTQAIAV